MTETAVRNRGAVLPAAAASAANLRGADGAGRAASAGAAAREARSRIRDVDTCVRASLAACVSVVLHAVPRSTVLATVRANTGRVCVPATIARRVVQIAIVAFAGLV